MSLVQGLMPGVVCSTCYLQLVLAHGSLCVICIDIFIGTHRGTQAHIIFTCRDKRQLLPHAAKSAAVYKNLGGGHQVLFVTVL